MAPLDAWYAGRPSMARMLDAAEMLMIDPPPASRMCGIEYFEVQRTPWTPTCHTASNASLVISATWLSPPPGRVTSVAAALLTTVVIGPYDETAASTAFRTSSSTA